MRIFKSWSETSPAAKESLAPSFELRDWSSLSDDEKTKILKHLASLGWFVSSGDKDKIVDSVDQLNYTYKVQVYGKALFNMGGPESGNFGYTSETYKAAADDFFTIIRELDKDVVFELLSFYVERLIEKHYLSDDPTDDDIDNAYKRFDRFSNAINEVFTQFGVNMSLTRQSFVPKQEQVVHELVVEPTLKILAAPKWKNVQSDFKDAITEYRKGTKKAYSTAITHIVSGVQAYLQLKVKGKIGKGEISQLIKDGMKSGVLPSDALSKKILEGIESELMEYRQKQGDAHPKAEYANEESARVILNLALVFIQHAESHNT